MKLASRSRQYSISFVSLISWLLRTTTARTSSPHSRSGHAYYCRLCHIGVPHQYLLNFLGRYHLATAFDEIPRPARQVDVTVLVSPGQVPGV